MSTKVESGIEKREDSTSQYQIRPSVGKSFPVVSIREIINEVLLQLLDGMEIYIYFLAVSIFLGNFDARTFFPQAKNTQHPK